MGATANSRSAGGARGAIKQLGLAGAALFTGFVVLPALIYFAGSALLGPFEGASLGTSFRSIYQGLGDGSIAAWIVVLGPYALLLLFKALRAWWRAGT
jgi:hypothetical protein